MASSKHSSRRIGYVRSGIPLELEFTDELSVLYRQQKCQQDNRAILEEKEAVTRRKQAQEEMKATRDRAREAATPGDLEDTSALDDLMNKLRAGDSVGRRTRRARRPSRAGAGTGGAAPSLSINPEATSSPHLGGVEAADMAIDMLATLKSDGFVPTPTSPTASSSALPTARRRRLRTGTIAADLAAATEGLELLEEQQEPDQGQGQEQEQDAEEDDSTSPAGSALRMLQALNSSEDG